MLNRILLSAALAGGALAPCDAPKPSDVSCNVPCIQPCQAAATSPVATTAQHSGVIELAICLDTSGSMQGLIDAARDKLWAIVNDLATASPSPKLRLALLSYGNDGLSQENGWVKVEVPFTENIDLFSERLFLLTTDGGTELVGRVVDAATQLEWTAGDDVLKLIFVAGNESADQDPVIRYSDACARSILQGIQVNAIYCGPATDEIAPGWREVATLADGHFASIDHNKEAVTIATPMDAHMAELSVAYNGTTLPFGAQADWGASNIACQDANAVGCGVGSAASRALTKCQSFYNNDAWDLVDAFRNDKIKLDTLDRELLPEDLRKRTTDEIRAHLEGLYEKRREIQASILDLQKARDVYLAEERKKMALDPSDQFDTAVRAAIRAQARAKGFVFADEAPVLAVEPCVELGDASPVNNIAAPVGPTPVAPAATPIPAPSPVEPNQGKVADL
ncbi:MAG: VWA domain-containing protein [Planctomycetes bacterium]|nr:VWA domain-containing protein [Planctomycetota bacterium]